MRMSRGIIRFKKNVCDLSSQKIHRKIFASANYDSFRATQQGILKVIPGFTATRSQNNCY